jgi:hypothetical protein
MNAPDAMRDTKGSLTNTVVTGYFQSVSIPMTVNIVVGIVLIITHDDSGYKSEWFTSDGFREMVIMILAITLCTCFFSLSIFLNTMPFFAKRRIFSFLSWVVAPMILFVLFSWQMTREYLGVSEYERSPLILLLFTWFACLLHLGALVKTYISFRKQQPR